MKFHGITLQEGSTVANMTLASGTSFPSNPNEGELFFRSDSDTSVRGMYGYIGGNWDRLASADAITVPSAANFPSTANVGDLFYKDSNDINEALYVYNGSSWVATGNSGGTSTVDGDLSGTISIGGTSTLTLDTVASAGTSGSASKTVTITIDAKGRVTSLTEQDVAITASQVTSGTFADARIAQSNVTQHQAAINIAASQVTSGTFTDARVAQSNVTQHQAALTIAETQITNGSVLARVADNETISGNWAFNGTVSGQTPTNGAHLVTKDYADALATGLDFKQSVKAATTTNITLSGSQTIDDVAISAGMRVLVKDQTDGTQNGIYVAAAGAWTRAADADNTPSNEVTSGMFCYVEEGTVNADSGWVLATNDVITLGSTNLVFTQFTGLGQITAGNGLTKSGNTINVGGNAGRIVVNVDDIDLATVTDSGTGSFKKISVDSYGRVTGTTDVVSSDITSLVDSTYVNAAGDTMTGLLTISRTGNGLVVASTDPTASNNSGIILNTTANATASSRIATIVLDANGADGTGGDYVTMNAFGSGDFTINNRNPAAITFQTNATERVRIDSSGNLIVGSATSSGFGLLQVSSSLQDFADFSTSFAGEAHVRIRNTTGNPVYTMYQNANTGTTASDGFWVGINSGGSAVISNQESAPLLLQTSGIERLRIDSSGVVTQTSNNAEFRLTESGTYYGSIKVDSSGGLTIGSDPSNVAANSRLIFGVDGSERMRIVASGSVGIGTSAPVYQTTIQRSATTGLGIALNLNNPYGYGTGVGTASVGIRFNRSPNDSGTNGVMADIYAGNEAETTSTLGYLAFATRNGASEVTSERMRIDASGNLMIGATTAAGILTVRGGTGAINATFDTPTAGDTRIEFKNNGTRAGYLYWDTNEVRLWSDGTRYQTFYTNGSERVRIDSSGNVGVGLTDTKGARFAVYGGSLPTASSGLTISSGLAAGRLATGNTNNTTAAIGQFLDNSVLDLSSGSTTPSGVVISGATSAVDSSTVKIFTVGSERVRINASGNVGIGTAPNSTYKLHVSSTGSNQVASQGTTDASFITNVNGTQSLYLHSTASMSEVNELRAVPLLFTVNGAERARIDASGNLLVGATSANYNAANRGLIELNGTTDALFAFKRGGASKGYLQAISDDGMLLANVSATGYLAFNTNANERMRIDASGNVGIGQATTTFNRLGVASSVGVTANGTKGTMGELFANTAIMGIRANSYYDTGATAIKATTTGYSPEIQLRTDNGAIVFNRSTSVTADTTLVQSESMRIDSSGNVGIGGSPTTKLDVISSAASDLISSVRNNGTTGASILSLSSGNGTTSSKYSYVRFLNSQTSPRDWRAGTYGTDNFTIRDETASSNRLAIDTNGNVGINMATAMTYKLEIGASGVLALNDSTNTNKGTLQMTAGGLEMYATGSKYIAFGSNSIERVRIDSSGNLLVGATSAVSSERARIENTSAGGVPNTLRLTNAGTTAGTGANLSFVSYTNATVASTIASISGISSDTAGNGLLAFNTSGVERMRIDASGNVLVTGSGGLGYGTGAGGTVTQATSKTTGVTLNKLSGAITLNASSLAANTAAAFTFTNSTIAASDVVHISVKSGMATGGSYNVSVDAVNTGSCNISVRNLTAGALAEALVLNFVVIKAATS